MDYAKVWTNFGELMIPIYGYMHRQLTGVHRLVEKD